MSILELPVEIQLRILEYLAHADASGRHPLVQLHDTCRAYRELILVETRLVRRESVVGSWIVRFAKLRETYIRRFLNLMVCLGGNKVRAEAEKIRTAAKPVQSCKLLEYMNKLLPGVNPHLSIPNLLMEKWLHYYGEFFAPYLLTKVTKQNIYNLIELSVRIYTQVVDCLRQGLDYYVPQISDLQLG